ncbi:DUF5908 family protein [Serratia marcescens]|uniref:DUF5908 family protein n=1 Tax=Serratia marcescens TaxID=615 RepID=UPI003FA7B21B
MTIEIRELVIEARVSELLTPPRSERLEHHDEEALIQKIVQQVLSRLHDEMRGMR